MDRRFSPRALPTAIANVFLGYLLAVRGSQWYGGLTNKNSLWGRRNNKK